MKTSQPLLYKCTHYLFLRNSVLHPGIQNRLNLIKQDMPDLSKVEVNEEIIDDLTSDPVQQRALVEHSLSDAKKSKKVIEFKRIERKYFGGKKTPNMLTWCEKEQIRFLNSSEPEVWSPEKLSKSFPATVDIVKKILKSQWKPKDSMKIKSHDNSVAQNWKLFDNNKLALPSNLAEHLKKFTSRKKILLDPALNLKDLVESKLPINEGSWSKLVKTNESTKKDDNKSMRTSHESFDSETFVIGDKSRHTRRHTTLDKLKATFNRNDPHMDSLDSAFEWGARKTNKLKPAIIQETRDVPSIESKFYVKDNLKINSEHSPSFIFIPKSKWKKGAIYRVNNCYYTDDGRFLYKSLN